MAPGGFGSGMQKRRKKRDGIMGRKTIAAFVAAVGICCAAGFVTGCGGDQTGQDADGAKTAQEEAAGAETAQGDSEEPASGEGAEDAGKGDDAKKKEDEAVLVVSFGTSYNDNRDATIGAVEKAIEDACPEYEVRRAFTSQIIIDKLKERDNLDIDNVEEALDRAVADGIKALYVQPTHLMDGYEYHDLAAALSEYQDKFDKIVLAKPLLSEDADYDTVIGAVTKRTEDYIDGKTAVCLMGHGTEAESNEVYEKLQERITEQGYEDYYVGTVEAEPTLDDVMAALKEKGKYERVVLEPLMLVAGDHANNDMAGEDEDSWKSILEKEGYEVECVLEGLGQLEGIPELYAEHIVSAISSGEAFTGGVKSAAELKEEEEGAGDLADGTYEAEVASSSSMFRVVKAVLHVEGGEMTADITLSGTGYGKLYMGTADEAANAGESDCIPYVEGADGAYTYTVPVPELGRPVACAAYSIKKETWYDRDLTFRLKDDAEEDDAEGADGNDAGDADENGADADGVDGNDADDVDADDVDEDGADTDGARGDAGALEDGSYSVGVTLEGGSGKSTVSSPATLKVENGKMVAVIEWSSPNYDYMLVGGQKYLPVNTEGNSVFEIPVPALDEEIEVVGDTVAMSQPHEVEYTLTFHSDTLEKKQE